MIYDKNIDLVIMDDINSISDKSDKLLRMVESMMIVHPTINRKALIGSITRIILISERLTALKWYNYIIKRGIFVF